MKGLRTIRAGMGGAAGAVMLLAAGCGQQTADLFGGPGGGPLTTEDFRGTAQAPAVVATTPPVKAGPGMRTPVVVSEPTVTGGLRDVVVVAGEPRDAVRSDAVPSGTPVFVDSVVGQINGRPVYAQKFFAPIDAQLRTLLKEKEGNARAWQAEAAKLIYDRLLTEIRDELFLAEARASLTPDEKRGLIHFLTSVRENIASMSGGSEAKAEEQLLESPEAMTLEQKARDERDKILIRTLASRQIQPRVNVSWRDVRRAYEKNSDIFNPPPTNIVRMVVAAPDEPGKPSAAQEIAKQLASGKPFEEVASGEWNSFSRADGGVLRRNIEGPYEQATIVANAGLNERARALGPNQYAGPFEFNGRQTWLHRQTITHPGRTLAEAQLEINQALRARKYNEEFGKFLQRLLERGSFSDVQVMTERLLAIASERYLGADRPTGPVPVIVPPPPPAGRGN